MMHFSLAACLLLLGLFVSLGVVGCADRPLPPVEQLPPAAQLPDPFLRADDTRVRTAAQWRRQREYLKEVIQYYGYGHMPPAPGTGKDECIKVESITSLHNDQLHATEQQLVLTMGPGHKVCTHVALTIPAGNGPFPAIIDGDLSWGKLKPEIVGAAVARGYIVAEFDRTEIAVDKNERKGGIYAAYPESDVAGLMAWAWGFSRVADYLLTLPQVDAKRLAVTGHSRGGKAALLAGVMDERFALVAPNDSGCGGTGCMRFLHGNCEDLPRITKAFPYWFSPRLATFAGQVDKLPYDQHTLKALVAPRPLLDTEALGDLWANPAGAQLTTQGAKVVYEFLGAGDRIAIVFREGKHEHNLQDWQVLLDFADRHLLGKAVERKFDGLHFPDEAAQAFSWTRP